MKKTEIVLLFGEEKLEALEFALRKERSSVQRKMDEALKICMSRRCRRRCGSTWAEKKHRRGSAPGEQGREIQCLLIILTEVKVHEKSEFWHRD